MKKYLLLFYCISLTVFIFPQQEEIETELLPVVITATKTETSFNELTSSVTVVTAKQIEEMKVTTVPELLRNVEGLNLIQQGGAGQIASVFMRGMNSNHTLVLIDGVELNDPAAAGNAYDFSTLQLNNVDRIEIVRGAHSTLYGSDAMGGVINIITRKGSGKPSATFTGETGSNAYYRWNGSLSGSTGPVNYAFNYSDQQSDGISAIDEKYGNTEKDGFHSKSFSSRAGADLNKDFSISLIYKLSQNSADLDQSEMQGDDPNYKIENEEQIWRAELTGNLFEDAVNIKAGGSFFRKIGYLEDKTDPAHPLTSSLNHTDAKKKKADVLVNTRLPFNTVSVGFEYELEEAYSKYVSNGAWGPYISEIPETNNSNTAFFLQDQINYQDAYLTIGTRNDNHEKFGNKFTYRIAPAYLINFTQTKIKFSYGTGLKAPSLYQLYDPMSGNPELKPEENKGWDAGIEQYLIDQHLMFSITYFSNKIDNLIGFDPVTYQSININKAETSGIESSASVRDFMNFDITANLTITKTKDLGNNRDDYGQKLIRRPDQMFNLNINYNIMETADINANFRFVGKREDKDFNTYPVKRIVLNDYSVIDLNAGYRPLQFARVFMKINNLLDTKYQETFLYGTPGRTFYAGVELNLK